MTADKCPIPLKPMAKWVSEADNGKCRPCLLGPVVQWYISELREQGEEAKAQSIETLVGMEDISPLTLCEELDKIKGAVEDNLRERLKDFDCSAQSFNQDAVEQEQHSE